MYTDSTRNSKQLFLSERERKIEIRNPEVKLEIINLIKLHGEDGDSK